VLLEFKLCHLSIQISRQQGRLLLILAAVLSPRTALTFFHFSVAVSGVLEFGNNKSIPT
jgi:hypothetical protein